MRRRFTPQPTPKPQFEQKQVRCFQCGAGIGGAGGRRLHHVQAVRQPRGLEPTITLAQTVSKNFRTHGRLVIEEKGYVLNADALVGDAVIKGRFIGKLVAEGTLELHSSANIKGSFTAARLVIPAGQHFRWPEPLRVGAADIGGELVADLADAKAPCGLEPPPGSLARSRPATSWSNPGPCSSAPPASDYPEGDGLSAAAGYFRRVE